MPAMKMPFCTVFILCLAYAVAAQVPAATNATVSLAVVMDRACSPDGIIFATELSAQLEKHAALVLVDRDQIEQLMGEQGLSVSGLVRSPVANGQLLGASYLLYIHGGTTPVQTDAALLLVEVSSGNVLLEQLYSIPPGSAGSSIRDEMLTDAASRVSRAIADATRQKSRPSAVVEYVRAGNDPAGRLSFLERSLCNMLEETLQAKGYRLLRREHPGKLYKETTLSTMGLTRPDMAVLAEAASLTVRGGVDVNPSSGKPFEDLPATLTLEFRPRGGPVRAHDLAFTLRTIAELTDKLPAMVDAVGEPPAVRERTDACREAASLMALLQPLYDDTAPFRDPPAVHRKQIEIAQRVIYLDPTIKEAYYLLGMRIKGLQMTQRPSPEDSDALFAKQLPEKELRRQLFDMNHPMWREQVDVFMTYLQFPRTDFRRTVDVFFYIMDSLPRLWPDNYERVLSVCADYAQWYAKAAPPPETVRRAKEMNCTLFPQSFSFEQWWLSQAQLRTEWYDWLSALYEGQPARGDIARRHLEAAALFLDQGNAAKAAEYMFRGVVTHRMDQTTLHTLMGEGPTASLFTSQLLEQLDETEARQVEERIAGVRRKYKPAPKPPLREMYGDFASIAEYSDVYEFSYHADDVLLGMRHDIRKEIPSRITLAAPICYTIAARTTESGLWVQGITPEGKCVMLHSPEPEKWRIIDFDFQGKAMPQVIQLDQVGEDIVMAAWGPPNVEYAQGLYVHNTGSGSWSHLGAKRGVPDPYVFRMCRDADGGALWMRERKTFKYLNGQIYLSEPEDTWLRLALGLRVPGFTQRLNGKKKLPVPGFLSIGPRIYNAGIYSKQRGVQGKDCIYTATPQGVIRTSASDTSMWYPDHLCYWDELAAFLKGNCPLPPTVVDEVIKDDRDPDLLWIVSVHDERILRYQFSSFDGNAPYGSEMQSADFKETRRFVTAFDTQKERFSTPVEVPYPTFVHIAPRGERVYFTGRHLGRLPKRLWVTDQTPTQDGTIEMMHADTPFGRAAACLIKGDKTTAIKELQTVTDPVTRTAAESAIRSIRGSK